MSIKQVLTGCSLLPLLSLGQDPQLPFNIQIATAKTPSLVNAFVDMGSASAFSDLIVSTAITPTTFELNNHGFLLDPNGDPAIRGRTGGGSELVGIFLKDTPTKLALHCSIASSGAPLLCKAGKFDTFVACTSNATTHELFLGKKGGALSRTCQVVTLKTGAAG